jgi:hypothetical protein
LRIFVLPAREQVIVSRERDINAREEQVCVRVMGERVRGGRRLFVCE